MILTGKRKQVDYTVSADRRLDHIPSTQHYAVEEVMLDLLHTAARMLVWCVTSICNTYQSSTHI